MQCRQLSGYLRRQFVVNGVVIVTAIALWAVAVCTGDGFLRVAASVGFALTILFLFVFRFITYARFRCPECRQRLPSPRFIDGEPIMFVCNDCQVQWDTGEVHTDASP